MDEKGQRCAWPSACLFLPQTSQADLTNVSLSSLCDSIPQLCAEGRGWRWWGDPAGAPRPAPQLGCPGPCRCSPPPTAEKSRGQYPTRGRGAATNEVPRPLPCPLAAKGSAAGVSGDDPGKPGSSPGSLISDYRVHCSPVVGYSEVHRESGWRIKIARLGRIWGPVSSMRNGGGGAVSGSRIPTKRAALRCGRARSHHRFTWVVFKLGRDDSP